MTIDSDRMMTTTQVGFMTHLRSVFHNQPIRLKMFFTYSLIVIAAILLVGTSIYYQVTRTISENIENELSNATATILNMVETTAKASIKNYLRAVAEKNLEIVSQYYAKVQNGSLSENDAKSMLRDILFSQAIGNTGYIYCVDSNGVAVEHPNAAVVGVNFANFAFVQEQMRRKQGYLEYEWQNPGEAQPRPKALYMTYFAPWDWIISVSSYRSEFKELINISDFKDSILSLRFGKTGYSYVIDSRGEVIVHPLLSGNLWDAQDAKGNFLARQQCQTKNGKIVYSWRNPGEDEFREKLVIYNYIEDYDWIVASTGYMEEFYAPLKSVRNIIVTTVLVIVVLVLPATFRIAGGITRPLRQLESKLAQGAEGDFAGRMKIESKDEIGNLAVYFNHFMDRLEVSNRKIQAEIHERRKTEELFSRAFQASPSGIFIANLNDKRLIDANPSFLTFIGRDHDAIIGQSVAELSIFQQPGMFGRMTEVLNHDARIRGMDVEFVNADGLVQRGIINAEPVHIWNEPCVLCAVEDLTETKRLEREIIDISERERLQLGQYLHDDLCSHLLGIEVLQKVLHQKLAQQGVSGLEPLDRLRGLVKDAIDKTRRISRGLCPTLIAGQELELTLEELCRDVEQLFGVDCRLHYDDARIALSPAMASHIYYIAREAAYNAVKHGNADHIRLNVSRSDKAAELTIIDDGCGLPGKTDEKGMGLRIMHYRAGRIGAILKVQSSGHSGTRVTLTFNPKVNGENAPDGTPSPSYRPNQANSDR